MLVGVIRMGLDFGYGSLKCGEEEFRFVIIVKVYFFYFIIIFFVFSFIVMVVIFFFIDLILEKYVSVYM